MNKYKLLDNTKDGFLRIFGTIKKAKKSVYVESYRIWNDSIGRELLNLLIKKSNEGVAVTIIVDSLGWGSFSKALLKRLEESSIELHIFNPIFQDFSWEKAKMYWNVHFRDHRKLTIVDSKVAYVGGMNYASRELSWTDMMVEIKGDILDDLILSSKEMKGIALKKNFKKRRLYKKLSKKFKGDDIIVRQVPYSKHRLLKRELMKIFSEAKKEIVIVTPYLVPDLAFRRSLRRALKRGVDVKLIVPEKSDMKMADMLNNSGSYLFTVSGAHVYLYPRMIHSKFVVVDSKVCSFGSSNLDYQTFNHNYELNIISENGSLVGALRRYFLRERRKCRLYEKQRWFRRSWFNRLIMKFLIRHKRHF